MKKSILITLLTVGIFTGCSHHQPEKKFKNCNTLGLNSIGCTEQKTSTNNIYEKVIVTKEVRQDNIVDYGQYAEIWIAPYKDKEGSLFNERTMNIWIKKPDFIIGEDLTYKIGSKTLYDNAKHKNFAIDKVQMKNSIQNDLTIELDENVEKYLQEY